jgi:transcriptional regulator with XRE-family HTH domain
MGQSIKLARVGRNWLQQDLAKELGVTRHAVLRWENGEVWPQERQRVHILGVDIPSEPNPMPKPPSRLPASHAPGIRYACAQMAQTIADLLREAADAETLAEAAAERERLIQQTVAAANRPPSAAPARRQRKG